MSHEEGLYLSICKVLKSPINPSVLSSFVSCFKYQNLYIYIFLCCPSNSELNNKTIYIQIEGDTLLYNLTQISVISSS